MSIIGRTCAVGDRAFGRVVFHFALVECKMKHRACCRRRKAFYAGHRPRETIGRKAILLLSLRPFSNSPGRIRYGSRRIHSWVASNIRPRGGAMFAAK